MKNPTYLFGFISSLVGLTLNDSVIAKCTVTGSIPNTTEYRAPQYQEVSAYGKIHNDSIHKFRMGTDLDSGMFNTETKARSVAKQ